MIKLIKLLFLLIIGVFILSTLNTIMAQDSSYVDCNECGYCMAPSDPQPAPNKTQIQCMECLYGLDASSSFLEIKENTLKINPVTSLPPQPTPGHMNTMIGCISIDGGFSQEGAVAGLANVVLGLIFKLAGAIAFLYILYGAFIVLTSQDNPEKLGTGKNILIGAIVGLVFCLLSMFILNLIANDILKIPDL